MIALRLYRPTLQDAFGVSRYVRKAMLVPGAPFVVVTAILLGAATISPAAAQDAAPLAVGEAAWNTAGCFQCHGTSGEGGAGAEFPAGPSLQATQLDRAALAETIACGLPGTPMPAWLDGAYAKRECYGFPLGPAPDGVVPMPVLSASDIDALVDYLKAKIVRR
jgi:mono/diheme cytochrome c family protein